MTVNDMIISERLIDKETGKLIGYVFKGVEVSAASSSDARFSVALSNEKIKSLELDCYLYIDLLEDVENVEVLVHGNRFVRFEKVVNQESRHIDTSDIEYEKISDSYAEIKGYMFDLRYFVELDNEIALLRALGAK